MLELQFLGTASAVSTADRIGCCLLIRNGAESLLIDCPGGISSRLAASGVDRKTIKHLFVTHRHIDHSAGFIELIYHLYLTANQERREPLHVHAHPGVIEILHSLFQAYKLGDRPKLFPIQYHPIDFHDFRPIAFANNLTLTPFESPHDPTAPTFGVVLERPPTRILYTADCNFSPPAMSELCRLAHGAALLITEATTLAPDSPYHGVPEQAIEFARSAGVTNLALLHLDPAFHHHLAARESLQKSFLPGRLLFPRDLETLTIAGRDLANRGHPIEFPYGRGFLSIECPFKVEILAPREPPPLANVPQKLFQSLKNPTQGESLESFLKGGKKVLVVISDNTRPTGINEYLLYLLNQIVAAGIPKKAIQIIIAGGIHRELTPDEIDSLTDGLNHIYTIQQHDATADHPVFQFPRSGEKVRLNAALREADKIILTGSIGWHYFAGFTGGRKSILPGLAHRDSIMANHRLVVDPTSPDGRAQNCRPGQLEGNPVHAEMDLWLDYFPQCFLVNTVLSTESKILEFFTGTPRDAHRAGCEYLRGHYTVPVGEPADVLLLSAGGKERDMNLVQAHKALDYWCDAVKPGGIIFFFARCSEGVGNKDLLRWVETPTLEEHLATLGREYQSAGQTAYALRHKGNRRRIFYHGDLPDTLIRKLGWTPFEPRGLGSLIRELDIPSTVRALAIPMGACWLPVPHDA